MMDLRDKTEIFEDFMCLKFCIHIVTCNVHDGYKHAPVCRRAVMAISYVYNFISNVICNVHDGYKHAPVCRRAVMAIL